jgi:hypothetical protein
VGGVVERGQHFLVPINSTSLSQLDVSRSLAPGREPGGGTRLNRPRISEGTGVPPAMSVSDCLGGQGQ